MSQRTRKSTFATCPMCGQYFSPDLILQHADACARARFRVKPKPSASKGAKARASSSDEPPHPEEGPAADAGLAEGAPAAADEPLPSVAERKRPLSEPAASGAPRAPKPKQRKLQQPRPPPPHGVDPARKGSKKPKAAKPKKGAKKGADQPPGAAGPSALPADVDEVVIEGFAIRSLKLDETMAPLWAALGGEAHVARPGARVHRQHAHAMAVPMPAPLAQPPVAPSASCLPNGEACAEPQPPPTGLAPVSAQPASAKPVSAQPASAKPVSAKPASAKPASAKPASAKPASAKPASAKPASAKPASAKPLSAKPVSAKPMPVGACVPSAAAAATEPARRPDAPKRSTPQGGSAAPAAPRASGAGAGAAAGAPPAGGRAAAAGHGGSKPKPPSKAGARGPKPCLAVAYSWPQEPFGFETDEEAELVERAEHFLEMLRYRFADKPAVIEDVMGSLCAFVAGEADTPEVMERVSTRLQHEPELLAAFTVFLPPGYCLQPVPSRHLPYLACISAPAAFELANSFVDRVCAQLAPAPPLALSLLRAIDQLPSDLPEISSVAALLGAHVDAGLHAELPVCGMSMAQAEAVRGAAADATALLQSCPMPACELARELMLYVPLGLQHGLTNALHGHTHYVTCDTRLPQLKPARRASGEAGAAAGADAPARTSQRQTLTPGPMAPATPLGMQVSAAPLAPVQA